MVRFGQTEDPRRRVLIHALAAGLFSTGLFPGSTLAQGIFGRRPTRLPQGQSIYRISGEVLVNGKPANLQTRIGANDAIQTAKDAEIVFVAGESAFVQRGASHVTVQADPGISLLVTGMRIVTGALLSVFPSRRPVRMTTQTATIGIRGTGVYLESNPQETYFCTCYGVAEISAINDKESTETVSASHHDKPLYIVGDGKPGQSIRRAPFINHTDQELMLIETLVGRTPPFVFPKDDYKAPRREY
jgi:hypothetical protein